MNDEEDYQDYDYDGYEDIDELNIGMNQRNRNY